MRIVKYDAHPQIYKGWGHWWPTEKLTPEIDSYDVFQLRDVFDVTEFTNTRFPVRVIEINLNNINVSLKEGHEDLYI